MNAASLFPLSGLLLLVCACSRDGDAHAGRKPAPTPVKTAVARTGDLKVYLDAIGNVKPLAAVNVRTQVGGILQKLHFTEGQEVKAGDLLAEIDPRPYEALLAQAQAQVAQAKGQVQQAAGQLAQARGQLARDQALLANARRDLARYKKADTAVSAQQADAATALVAQYEGAVAADEGAVAAAEGAMSAGEGAAAAAGASVDNAKVQLSYCRIMAPFDGQVGIRTVDEGNLVGVNDAAGIVTVSRMRPISAFFYVAENDLPALTRAVAAGPRPEVLAFDSDRGRLLAKGELAALDNQLDPATGTVRLRAVFDNKDLELFPNRSVSVRLLVATRAGATLVPSEAVQIADQKRFLYVVKPDAKQPGAFTVERRDAKVGRMDDDQAEILEGALPGERIAVDGLDRLKSGARVVPDDGGKHEGKQPMKHDGKEGAKEPR